ncbi:MULTISPECIES: 3'-5' exoribonuclease YhaM [unclassified Sporosarcina]|uniref:3'-5' exoribonuclease YhaM n=1 Tax=unclassified Sporosarcina TaxID=2647733 RepID=UPI000C16C3B8|nr:MULTISPECIES: 3'-5' exoribonuclease YhaM [unclassified Sporosarcina]PIC98094.1 3'-5' exoribonuclease YhaM [Sporosarcina sp. P29]PID04553.1 3'-5' exoribonuclease YhaM [Sporosarcina sp. P30]PID07695.1 3'-5' exoribonuclease YhaM [Sporosarcina sp. P31]PID10893.1 3'-5' exoribonuclease YhaM [Sporosarcina sp. P32b]
MKKLLDYQVGETIDMYLLIKQATKGVTQQGSPFMTLILQDKSGDLEAKLWDAGEEQAQMYQGATIVKVGGEVHEYRGKNQLRLKAIRPVKEDEGVTIADLVPSAEKSKEVLLDELMQYFFEMKNPQIQRVTRHLLKKHQQDFVLYPAATRNHHDYVSGLLDHVVSMLKLGKAIAELYPTLNKDLLYAGIILHDIGKVIELSGPVGTQYTIEGNLLGHITIMVNEISKAAEELEIEGEEVMLLQHMVLSHHGKEEWGSPKRPMLKEAEILHYIDNIDAKMNMLNRVMSKTTPGEFSERVFPLDNRSFYKPTFE